jgi:ribosome-binding protein aMBF1 (putative translation factor)
MIRSDKDYRGTVRRIRGTEEELRAEEERLEREGRTKVEIKRLLDDVRTVLAGLIEEKEMYERLLRRDYSDLVRLEGLGQVLVALRIGEGLTQRELAEKLGVDESLISRDERNEYHGITVERAKKILAAMGFNPALLLKHAAIIASGTGGKKTASASPELPPLQL